MSDHESASLASYIDHTLLKPEASREAVLKLCAEAREYKFCSVCVNSSFARLATEALAGSGVKTCCVIGFPLGAASTRAKVAETQFAVEDGADEIDMVIQIGALKDGNEEYVENDIREVKKACGKALLKVIIETGLLTDEEKVLACRLSKKAGADFVKTSTGFGHGGATVEDVRLMRKTVGQDMQVKASGGIRSYEDAKAMIDAGADRLGASSGIAIVKGETSTASY
ncbi:MAG: deoxyribose-phosphate aldolase [Desulfovibrio sp.]|uniref:deoxyribose-phosphate aldolase n=1 Tax=Desulfovibrio sp. 7SRBS1 TaxID=3378064 RepID=UPI003B3CCB83